MFTNQQLTEIVKKRPQSLAELTQINGIGKGKAEKYGEEILKISKINLGTQTENAAVAQVEEDGKST